MDIIKQKIQQVKKENSAFRWKVPSVSDWGTYHHVSYGEKLGWDCDCVAFKMSKKRTCKHIKIVKSKHGGEKIQGVQSNLAVLEDR